MLSSLVLSLYLLKLRKMYITRFMSGFMNRFRLAVIAVFLSSVNWSVSSLASDGSSPASQAHAYDFVVVGAGAGGGTLAASLSRKINATTGTYNRVLLLEAGEQLPEDEFYFKTPAMHPVASERPGLAWKFFVEHYEDTALAEQDSKRCPGASTCAADDVGVFYPRGSTVGGSTAVNAMISVVPHNSDWDNLASQTNDDSWSAANMRQYLTRLERNTDPFNPAYENHLQEGWLPISFSPQHFGLNAELPLDYLGIISTAAQSFGYPPLPIDQIISDVNSLDPAQEGLYLVPSAVDGHARRGGVRNRVNNTVTDPEFPLTLKTGAFVTKILFDDDNGNPTKAIGVEYRVGSNLYSASYGYSEANTYETKTVQVNNEVVISAGAFNTPQLLMLSGIGDQTHLSEEHINIPTRVHLPEVGMALQDRYEVPVIFERKSGFDFGWIKLTAPKNFVALNECNFDLLNPDACFTSWFNEGIGAYSQTGALLSIIHRSQTASTPDPDLFFFALGGSFKGYYPNYSDDTYAAKNQFTWAVLKAHNNNRGSIRLKSADPFDQPIINFNYFGGANAQTEYEDLTPEHRADLDSLVEGVKLIRSAAPLASAVPFELFYEVWPGKDIDTDTDEEIRAFIMAETWGHHACCTAGIGAVVDSRFRVYGTQNLRVVDASVFPEIPGFFIAMPTMMVGEKAADVIAEDN